MGVLTAKRIPVFVRQVYKCRIRHVGCKSFYSFVLEEATLLGRACERRAGFGPPAFIPPAGTADPSTPLRSARDDKSADPSAPLGITNQEGRLAAGLKASSTKAGFTKAGSARVSRCGNREIYGPLRPSFRPAAPAPKTAPSTRARSMPGLAGGSFRPPVAPWCSPAARTARPVTARADGEFLRDRAACG